MAFKKNQQPVSVPDSPEKLFLDLPRRKYPRAMAHQEEIMNLYVSKALDKPDVALQLPTGSGKTLVGLLIAEWRRKKYKERVVYLCPTNQLVNQVVEQAEEQYGLNVLGFTGSIQNYDPEAKAAYRSADRVAVTNYSSLFNTNPFFKDADIIIVDDVHAAESYIAALWSVRIERSKPEHTSLHAALCGILKPDLDAVDYTRLSGQLENLADHTWVDKVPTPEFVKIKDQVIEVIDAHVSGTDLMYPWSMVREHLNACQLYLSSQEILIRPLIPPTWTHKPFTSPKQRIYMSATLGAGGDLERLTGRKSIFRLPVPTGWDRQAVGRRFFIFPEMSLGEDEVTKLRHEMMHIAKRSLVLVPTDRMRDAMIDDIGKNVRFKTFNADSIEKSKKPFIESPEAIAVISNRYDGIDFPQDECRLLFIEGLPKTTNIQERFIMSRMGANALFNERIQTRVLQAIGRCTRSLNDYSAVVVSGGELPDYLADIKRRKFFDPELQAELVFGINQSKGTLYKDIIENFKIFLENGERWEEANQQIVAERKSVTKESFPAMEELMKIVDDEINFQIELWQGDFVSALGYAEKIIGILTAHELIGYRALWYYFAGSAAWLAAKNGASTTLETKAQVHFEDAKKRAYGIRWLVGLTHQQAGTIVAEIENSIVFEQVERVESVLADLGTSHDRFFAKREKEILDGLALKNSVSFERAHRLLGELLGFNAGKIEDNGSPDPWWIIRDLCFVFEDHSDAKESSTLGAQKARQAALHPNWMRANVEASIKTDILPVIITPVSKVERGAVPHLSNVSFWAIEDFRLWAKNALAVIRDIRKTFVEPGDLEWRTMAVKKLEIANLSAPKIFAKLKKQSAMTNLRVIK